MNLIIGAANTIQEDWISTDIDQLDVTKENDWKKILGGSLANKILAEHVWEHLTKDQAILANINVFNFLKPGGNFRIAVPDGLNPNPDYINYVRPGGHGAGALDHKILYDFMSLEESLKKCGFVVELLEYWDENGIFKFKDWDICDGKVNRSRRFDQRNQNGKLNYTSLIIDAKKPKF